METREHTEAVSLRQVWPAIVGLSVVFLVEMLDTSVLTVALPTIARDLGAGASDLQWIGGAYALVFGGFMLVFGTVADRYGRRRVMLGGLALFGLANLAVVSVTSAAGLVGVRAACGLAAAMTAPGSMALSFRLFDDDALRVRATALISTVGLVGLAVGPTLGGLALAVAPWQALLLANVPIAALAWVGIRVGVPADDSAGLHRVPVDWAGALLGAATASGALGGLSLLVEVGATSPWPWVALGGAAASGVGFVARERRAVAPVLEAALLRRPGVRLGLAYQFALAMALAALGYTVTLHLQLAWGWPPALAALGTLPQVLTMIASGPLVEPVVRRVGLGRAGALGAASALGGLVVYAVLGRLGYPAVAAAMVLVAAGMRLVMVTATINVMRGLPPERTSLGAALNDTGQELGSALGIAVMGMVLASALAGSLGGGWTPPRVAAFEDAVTVATLGLVVGAGAVLLWASREGRLSTASSTVGKTTPL